MLDLVHILDQYELLDLTAHHLRPIDLFNTALTCKRLHSIVLRSKSTFERLKRVTLCDGTGLRARQEYTGLFAWRYLSNKKPFYDEEIEAKVWNLRCDEHGALPCLKCGTNVCGECRYVTRVRDTNGLEFSRRPHFTYTHQRINLIVYCGDCGVVVQEKSGDALCDCDQYTRWICVRCKTKEIEDERWYSKNRTEHTDDDDGGMLLSDHQCQKAVGPPPCQLDAYSLGAESQTVLVSLR